MKQYVVGFLFDQELSTVVLVKKNRPSWQAGLLNGIGGKIEPGETPGQAMTREFEEETGFRTISVEWTKFCVQTNAAGTFEVHYFYSVQPFESLEICETITDEEIVTLVVDFIDPEQCTPQTSWLLQAVRALVVISDMSKTNPGEHYTSADDQFVVIDGSNVVDTFEKKCATISGVPATILQPLPTINQNPAIHDLVVEDVRARKALGISKYGTALQADNGRSALVDAYQEVLDLAAYLKQEIEERRMRSNNVDFSVASTWPEDDNTGLNLPARNSDMGDWLK